MSDDSTRPNRTETPTSPDERDRLDRLRRLNLIATVFFAAQVIVLLLISEPAKLPVIGSFLTDAPGSGQYGSKVLFDLRIDIMVALFLALAAIDHFAVGSFARRWYEKNIVRGINPARWWEYSISASIMVVLIAMLAGVSDAVALLAIFGVNASMILFGLVMERANLDREQVDWAPFVYGCIAGAVPWVAIAIQLVLAQSEGDGVPGFVYGIFISLFVLFNGFAVNMWLAYRGNGRWKDPLFVERVYIILSFVAKTVLAWQVYQGALAGA
jgi:hypothetical protein